MMLEPRAYRSSTKHVSMTQSMSALLLSLSHDSALFNRKEMDYVPLIVQ